MKVENTVKTSLSRSIKNRKSKSQLGDITGRDLKALIKLQCKETDIDMKYIFGSGIGDWEAGIILGTMMELN
jgi:hypothetical protein